MADRKLAKRVTLATQIGQRYVSVPGGGGQGPISTAHQYFYTMHAHKAGSTRPKGYLHRGFDASEISVHWLWTPEHEFFAPKVEFNPEKADLKLVVRLTKILKEYKWSDRRGPNGLADDIGAVVVEHVDNIDGAWDDYRVIRMPGDTDMMVIARAAL